MLVFFWRTTRLENREELRAYVLQLQEDLKAELESATGIPWNLELTDELRLEKDEARRPSDFLDSASQRMAEGPYDMVAVVTDVGLMSRKHIMVPGLSSSVSRIVALSTRKLRLTPKGQPRDELMTQHVRFNSTALMLKLVGNIFGLKRSMVGTGIMAIQDFDRDLKKMPRYSSDEREKIKKRIEKVPDRELVRGNWLESFIFHVLMSLRHPKELIKPIIKNNSFLLPLSLPGLATAAVAPAFIFIFTAEIWDVGLGMTNLVAILYAIVSVLFASFYLVSIQSLFLPRKEKRILTEHLAVANAVIYCSIFLACVGLFIMLCILMLIMEFWVFPPDLMQTWPTLETGQITLEEQLRLAVFIATVGVTTGALAGGMDKRTVIQHLALFNKNP